MGDVDTAFLAARLFAASAVVLLLPGLALLTALRVAVDWPERVVLAFSLSYSWIFVMSVVVPLMHWTVDHAVLVTLVLLLGLSGAVWMQIRRRPRQAPPAPSGYAAGVLLGTAILAFGVAAWFIEPPFTGEEALDFVAMSRVADGGPITLANTSLFPETPPAYLFQPYQLALGMIAHMSGTDPLVAFVKFRSFAVPLCLVAVLALLRQLAPTRTDAVAAFVVVIAFIALDVGVWESNSLFPYVRRGGIGAGICVPVLLVLYLIATRRAHDTRARASRRVALGAVASMLMASLSTHALEMFPFLYFSAAATVAIAVGLDPQRDRRRALALTLILGIVSAAFLAVHSRAVPYVGEFERDMRLSFRSDLARLVADPFEAVAGATPGARDMLSRSFPATTATVVGVPALAVAALHAPAAAAVLALAVVPLALLYASPAGYVIIALATSPATVNDINGYFGLMGLTGLALGLVALAHAILNAAAHGQRGFVRAIAMSAAGSVALWTASLGYQAAIQRLASTPPETFLMVAAVVGAVVLLLAATRARPILGPAPFPSGVVALSTGLALLLAAPDRSFGDAFVGRNRETVFERFQAALHSPSVLDWPLYYEELRQSIAPPLPIPRGIVDELRHRMPPRRILLAHPRYSCALVVLIDAYCVNPERIYGHYFQPAARYHAEYVVSESGQGPQHPLFNSSFSLTSTERRFLAEYGVSYILADADHAESIARKLRDAAISAQVELNRDGYRLFRIGGS